MKPDTTNPDPYQRTFRYPKWTRLVRVTDEHRLFSRLPEFRDWTRARHEQVSRDYLAQARATERVYNSIVSHALTTYGDHGPLISGVIRDHFPDATRHALRVHARLMNDYTDRSITHWRAARNTMVTWRRLRDAGRADSTEGK